MEYPRRKPLRLRNYDYAQNGAYFVTICTERRQCLFGPVGADSISARMVRSIWEETLRACSGISCPISVVMPNHFHAILEIERADMESAPTVSAVVQSFKRHTTIRYIALVKKGLAPPFEKRVWQRSYYDHIIRNEEDYLRIWQYIETNPAKWAEDKYFEE